MSYTLHTASNIFLFVIVFSTYFNCFAFRLDWACVVINSPMAVPGFTGSFQGKTGEKNVFFPLREIGFFQFLLDKTEETHFLGGKNLQ